MSSAAEVEESERRYVAWWGRAEVAYSSIGVGHVAGTARFEFLGWIKPWLFLLVGLCILLVGYGVRSLRRLGSPPSKRDGFRSQP